MGELLQNTTTAEERRGVDLRLCLGHMKLSGTQRGGPGSASGKAGKPE